MSSDLTSIQYILRQIERGDRPSLEVDRRFEKDTAESEGRQHPGQLFEEQSTSQEPAGNQRRRDAEAILSLTEAIYSECAVDADALGFMAKMLVQTTLPHRAQPGKQYTRSDGDVTLSITDLGGSGLAIWRIPAPDSRLDDDRSSTNGRTQAGAWTFAVQLYGATRFAVYGGPLGNDSAV